MLSQHRGRVVFLSRGVLFPVLNHHFLSSRPIGGIVCCLCFIVSSHDEIFAVLFEHCFSAAFTTTPTHRFHPFSCPILFGRSRPDHCMRGAYAPLWALFFVASRLAGACLHVSTPVEPSRPPPYHPTSEKTNAKRSNWLFFSPLVIGALSREIRYTPCLRSPHVVLSSAWTKSDYAHSHYPVALCAMVYRAENRF